MAKNTVDERLREMLKRQREGIVRKGILIENKSWRKGVIRPLPCNGEPPGREYRTVYCEEVGKSVTLPSTFGLPDPLWDYMERVKKTGDKEAKEHAADYANVQSEFWMPCVIRGDEGTPGNPNVMIFRAKPSVYEQITEWMIDEEIGEDITSPRNGRDIYIKKTGEGKQTRWKADRMDSSKLCDDKALYAELCEIADGFDVAAHMFPFHLDLYEEVYQGLTDEEIPDDVREQLEELDAQGGRVSRQDDYEEEDEIEDEEEEDEIEEDEEEEEDEDDDEEEDDEEEDDEEDEDEEEEDEEGDVPEGIEVGKTRVTFDFEGDTIEGVVIGTEEDSGECTLLVVEDEGDEDDPYYVGEGDYDIVETDEADEDDDEEEEEDPEEAPPVVRGGRKKKRSKKSSSKATAKPMPRQPKKTSRKARASAAVKTTRKAKARPTSKKKTTKKAGTGRKIRSRSRG